MIRSQYLTKYINRLDDHLSKLKKHSENYSYSRLAVFLLAILWIAFTLYTQNEIYGYLSILFLFIIFPILGLFHSKVQKSIHKAKIWKSIKKDNLNRLNLNWEQLPKMETQPLSNHPFAYDLDICGEHSLLRLLNNGNNLAVANILKKWLLSRFTNTNTLHNRQQMVRELKSLHNFRDRLQLNGKIVSEREFKGQALNKWLQSEAKKKIVLLPVISLSILAFLNIALLVLFILGLQPYFYFSLILYISVYFFYHKHIQSIFNDMETITTEIKKVSQVLLYIEKFSFFKAERVKKLCATIQNPKQKPSVIFRKLNVFMALIGLRMNPILMLILNMAIPYDYYLALYNQHLKKKLSAQFSQWLAALNLLESYAALANFAWLNPEYTFPIIGSNRGKMKIESSGLGHPLIPKPQKVSNDFHLNKTHKIYLLTGSNMSGKSTFLRTVGINLVLAYSGAPVDARHFFASPFQLFTCIKISDSLNEGLSYFYAEVKRLKQLLDELKSKKDYPLFFLIDEIFKGTNNKERSAGSFAYIKEIANSQGAGLVSTHDLELTSLADDIDSMQNAHFHETIQNNKMNFDYKLKPGPCPTTNALKIMEMEGLPVHSVSSN
jgi:hypothetical protein